MRLLPVSAALTAVLAVSACGGDSTAEAAGGDLSRAVRVGVYLRDFADFAAMNEIYAEFFGTTNLPARTTVPAALDGFDIEIDAVIYLGD